MLARTCQLFVLLACALLLVTTTLAQQSGNKPAANESQFVDFSGFKGKVFEIKHRDPSELAAALRPLGSGFKGAIMQYNHEFKTLIVRDFPENIAAIEEAIKRLDVPQPARPARLTPPNIEVTAYVLIGSNNEAASGAVPAPLKDVLAQLQTTLGYKGYQLLTPIVQRSRLNFGHIASNGTATLPDKTLSAEYKLRIGRITSADKNLEDNSLMVFDNFQFSLRGVTPQDQQVIGNADIDTQLQVRDGEKVVVGTASLKDKALILVLTAKVLK